MENKIQKGDRVSYFVNNLAPIEKRGEVSFIRSDDYVWVRLETGALDLVPLRKLKKKNG